MASQARTSAGSRIYLSLGLPATYNTAGFSAVTYTEIGEISDGGAIGRAYNLVTFMPLGDRKVVKRKGSYNNGKQTIKLAHAPLDGGQVLLQAGLLTDASCSVKVVLQSGTTYYYTVQIMNAMLEIGGVDTITSATAEFELDSDIVTGAVVA